MEVGKRQLSISPDALKVDRQQQLVSLTGTIIALLALTGTVISLNHTMVKEARQIGSAVDEVSSDINQVQEEVLAQCLRITSPDDGDSAGLSREVIGATPFAARHHYLIVRPVASGTKFVQPGGPLGVHNDDLWPGVANFGSAAVGSRKTFILRCTATSRVLQEGPIGTLPEDAISSNSVRVIRR